jgi:hypothetical protein
MIDERENVSAQVFPVYYFGCLGNVGHYLHAPGGIRAQYSRVPVGFPGAWAGGGLDGTLLDNKRSEVQGLGRLHHLQGWTALAFWDRSVDNRPGSNSAFVAKGTHSFQGMLALSRKARPQVFARFTFEVVEDER